MAATNKRSPLGIDPCDEQLNPIFNATTQKRNVVDTRTGLFEAYVPLPKVTGNAGRGPVLDLSLFYTPVVNNHACLGDGWSFAFSFYNESLKRLTLSGGEVLSFDKSANHELNISSINVKVDGNTIIVTLADGHSEELKKLTGTPIWLPAAIKTIEKFGVTLEWQPVEDDSVTYIRLLQVSDPVRTLATLDYGKIELKEGKELARNVTIKFWPADEDETLEYKCQQIDYSLRSVVAPDGSQVKLKYQDHSSCGWLLNDLTTFEGVRESVSYVHNGLAFDNDKKLTALPCVSEHTLEPLGENAKKVVSSYQYIPPKKGESGYQTQMTQGARQTTFYYDKDHSVVKEEEAEGSCTLVTSYVMSNESGISSRQVDKKYTVGEDSKSSEKMPTFTQVAKWEDGMLIEQSGRQRKTLHKSVFAPLFRHEVENDYGEFPERFFPGLTEIHSKSVAYFGKFKDGVWGDVSVEIVGGEADVHAYAIDAVRPALMKFTRKNDWKKPAHVAVFFEHSAEEAPVWFDVIHDYDDGDINSCSYGRLTASHQAQLKLTYAYALEGTALTLTTTQTAGKSDRVTSETCSILSGRLVNQVDADGNVSRYDYDKCGRLVTFTQCAESDTFKQVTAYTYPKLGRVETTEPDGKRCATEDDGQGNVIAEYVHDSKRDGWIKTLQVEYDESGRRVKTTEYEDIPGCSSNQSCQFEYDEWGRERLQIFSDGRHIYSEFDPIKRTLSEWSGVVDEKDKKTRISALKTTTYNTDDSVSQVQWAGTDDKVWQTQTFSYTHAFQIKEQTTQGPHGEHKVEYTYDASGRPLTEFHVERAIGATKASLDYTYSYEYPSDIMIREASKISLNEQVLGTRDFDEWGRVTSMTRGGITEQYKYDGAASVPMSKTIAGSKLEYSYIPELGQRIASISGKDDKGAGVKKIFTYMHGMHRKSSAKEGEQFLEFNYDLDEHMTQQRATLNNKETSIERTSTPAGRLLAETDVSGMEIDYSYNDAGQRNAVNLGQTRSVEYTYNSRGQLGKEIIQHDDDLIQALFGYNDVSQEISRRFILDWRDGLDGFNLGVVRRYFGDGKLKSIALKDYQDEVILGSHTYEYSPGGRLSSCTSTGVWRPQTPKGTPIAKEEYEHGPLGNVTRCVIHFGKETCIKTFIYEADKGYRLHKVLHDHADYRKQATLEYDAAGRVIRDASGKTYSYDWLGRLVRAGSRYYTYDPADRLVSRSSGAGEVPHQVIYEGLKVRAEHSLTDAGETRKILPGSSACQVQLNEAGAEPRTLLTLCDDDGTVLMSMDLATRILRHHAYTAYGEHRSEKLDALHGYNGEYLDPENAHYPLGHGYRWYSPQSTQFQAPDSLSPFDEGGPHAYGYCDGDPVNFKDPSGHFKVRRSHWDISASEPPPLGMGKTGALISTILWSAVGVLTAVMTGGASLIITGILVGLAAAAMATAIASVVVADSNPEAAEILGWVSLGCAAAGGVAQLTKNAATLAVRLSRSGMAVARRLVNKVAVAAQHVRHRITRAVLASRGTYIHPARARFYDARYVSKSVDPTPNYKTLAEPTQTVRDALKAFELGDVNTVVCCVSGVLNNSAALENEDAAWAGSQINNATNLYWGHFRFGEYARSAMFRGSALRFR